MKCCETCNQPMPGANVRRKFCSERCRKQQYSKPCPECGKAMSGCNGRGESAPKTCADCCDLIVWSRELICARIREWFEKFGVLPATTDWSPGLARDHCSREVVALIEAEFSSGHWPATNTVVGRFGSWNAGIVAAGYSPRRSGERMPRRQGLVAA